jgi:hypothetical protein
MKKILLTILSVFSMLFGFMFIIIFLFFDATFEQGSIFTMFTLLGLTPFLGGSILLIKTNRKGGLNLEKAIIKQAYRHKGQLTISDVSIKQSLSFKQAEAVLTKMYRDEIFEVKISLNGSKVYELLHFATDQQKENSEGLL